MLCQQSKASSVLLPVVWGAPAFPPASSVCKERDGQTSLALVCKPIVVHEKNIFLSKLVDIYLQEAYVLFLQSPHFTFLIWAGYYAIALCVFSSQRRVNPMSHWTPEAGLAVGRHRRGRAAAPGTERLLPRPGATGHRAQAAGAAQAALPLGAGSGGRGRSAQPQGTGGRSPRSPCAPALPLVFPLIMRRERCVKPWLSDYPALSHDAARWLVRGNEIRFR